MTTEAADKTEIEKEKKDIVKHEGTRTSGGRITRLEIKSFAELENLALILGKSDIVPKDMIGKPANILLALMFGNELGLTPAQSLQNIMVVNGRPCLWGDATMGLVMASDVYEDSKDELDLTTMTATFKVKRKGKDWVTRTFSKEDAQVAKLWTKEGPWQNYPKRMLFHRARSWALRDTFPDVLKGIRYYEEERDVIDTTATHEPEYALPTEKKAEAAAPAPAAEAAPIAQPEAGKEVVFKVTGGADTELEGVKCFVVRDDADPPTKYYHDKPDWHALAKAAKDAKAWVTATWTDKPTKKGPARWLTGLSLRS